MKKICFLAYDLSKCGGLGRVITSIANSLCENEEYEFHMVSVCNSRGNNFWFPLDERIKQYVLGVNYKYRFRQIIFKSFSKLKKYLQENKIDILFLADYTIPPIAMLVKPFVKTKIVFCDHGTLSNQLDHKKSTAFRRIGCWISDKIAVLTKRNSEDYKKYFKIKENKLLVIPNWLEDELIESRSDYDTDSKIILSCGRFTSEKGFDMLADVADMVFRKHPDWQWHVYGGGPEFENVKEQISKYELENNVILKGFVNNMDDKYRDAAIFVLLSYREGLSLVLMEAKANAIPLVSFNCIAGPSEIINDGVDGYLITCYDKEKMASKICKLIENQELRQDFSANAKSNLGKFSKAKILKQWTELINSF